MHKAPTFEYSLAAQPLGKRAQQSGAGAESCRGLQQGSGQQGAQRRPLETSAVKPARERESARTAINSLLGWRWCGFAKGGCGWRCLPGRVRCATPAVIPVCSGWVVTGSECRPPTRTSAAPQQELFSRMRQAELLSILDIAGHLATQDVGQLSHSSFT